MQLEKGVINIIKAIIFSSEDGNIKIDNLEDVYNQWTHGESIPYLKLGYKSLFNFLRNYPEIKIIKNSQGESVYTVNPIKKPESANFNNWKMDRKNEKKENRYVPYKTERQIPFKNKRSTPINFDYSSNESYYSSNSSFESLNSKRSHVNFNQNESKDMHEPILNGQQLIGDDFFLQMAIRCLDCQSLKKEKKKKLLLDYGLCISGQTIKDCTNRLRSIQSMSNKVTIMLGSADIYKGRSLEQMEKDYLELLHILEVDFKLPKSAITIGTIPPLANVSFVTQFEKYSTLVCFNIRQLSFNNYDIIGNKTSCFKVIDFHKEFMNDYDQINYDLFEENARNVSRIKQAYVFFNEKGRSKAVSLFFTGTQLLKEYFPPSLWYNNPFTIFS